MKILHLADTWSSIDDKPKNGVVTIFNKMTDILREDHTVVRSIPSDSTNIREDDHVWSVPSLQEYNRQNMGRGHNKIIISELKKHLASNKYDLIISHNMRSGIVKGLFRSSIGVDIPRITYSHNAPIYGMTSLATLEAYEEYIQDGGHVIGVSEFVMNSNNRSRKNTTNGFQYLFYTEEPELVEYPRDIASGIFEAIFIPSRINPVKKTDLILEATKSEKVILVGDVNDASWDPDFVNRITKSINDNPHIEFRGQVSNDEVLGLMAQSHMIIDGDERGACPTIQMEAAVMGCPVLKLGAFTCGFTEIKAILENTPLFQDINLSRMRQDKKIATIRSNLSIFDQVTESDRLNLANTARRNYSKDMWKLRFNNTLKMVGL